jgi:hypothetical protein
VLSAPKQAPQRRQRPVRTLVVVGLLLGAAIGASAAMWPGGLNEARASAHHAASLKAASDSPEVLATPFDQINPGSQRVLFHAANGFELIGRCTNKGAEVRVITPKGGEAHVISTDHTLGFKRETSTNYSVVGESPPGDQGTFNAAELSGGGSLDGSFLTFGDGGSPCTFEASAIAG